MNALLIGLVIALGAPAPKEAPEKEPASLLGEWVGESGLKGGKPDKPPPGTTITFAADGKVILKEGRAGKAEEATYKADPKKDPPEIDLFPPVTEKESPLLGIYKIEGDTLTICLAKDGERPKTFASPAGSKVMLITCKRAKKE
jgi:uncharacterized protein (TIGR03067 family)